MTTAIINCKLQIVLYFKTLQINTSDLVKCQLLIYTNFIVAVSELLV